MTLRKRFSEAYYRRHMLYFKKDTCPFCMKDMFIKEYGEWMILGNRFPYDKIAKKHDLLCLKDHSDGSGLYSGNPGHIDAKRMDELLEIKEEIKNDYDCFLENFNHGRTIPSHYHIHLIKYY